MITPAPIAAAGPRRSQSRATFALRSGLLLLAVTISAVLATVLAGRLPFRLDLTATREHLLAPSTQAVLDSLPGPVDLLLAADLAAANPADRAVRRQLLDVLERFERHPRVRVTLLDTSSPDGRAQYDAALARLADRAKPAVAQAADRLARATTLARDAGTRLAAVATALDAIRERLAREDAGLGSTAPTFRQYFQQQAAAARIASSDLTAAADQATKLTSGANTSGTGVPPVSPSAPSGTGVPPVSPSAPGGTGVPPVSPLPIPPFDSAALTLRTPIARLAADLTTLQTGLETFARRPEPDAPLRAAVTALAADLPALRDALARQALDLETFQPPALLRIARTLDRQRAALLLADPSTPLPPGREPVAAVDLTALLPADAGNPAAANAPALDIRPRQEELLAAGFAAFTPAPRPLVVLTHGEASRFAPNFGSRTQTLERLALQGFECTEWAAALDDQPPPAARATDRPVVFVSTGVEATNPEAAARMGRLAAALGRLVREGRSVLLSVNVSTLPGVGAPDPMVEFLEPLGLKADSGRPLLEEVRGVRRQVLADQDLPDPRADHPISLALRGTRTFLPWCVPLRPAAQPPAGIRITPVITIPPRPTLWASSEWLAFRQTPPAQRATIANPPARGSPGDDLNTASPWLVAAALERPLAESTQRLVVVASEGWFSDTITTARLNADGREVLAAPGNFDLLSASLWWLAGQESRIARSAGAQAVPTIPDLTPAQVTLLRWILAAGIPVLVLLTGAAWRLWRG